MKYQESFSGEKAEFGAYIKKVVPELFSGNLTVEGKKVSIPADAVLDYKIKHDEDEAGGSVTIKVAWDNSTDDDEDEEDTIEV